MKIENKITHFIEKKYQINDCEKMYIANIEFELTRIFKRTLKGKKYTVKTETRNVTLKEEIFVESLISDSYVVDKFEKKLTSQFEKHSQETFVVVKATLLRELSYVNKHVDVITA